MEVSANIQLTQQVDKLHNALYDILAEKHPEFLNDTYVMNNMAHVHIYFKQLHFMQQERKERFTGLELLANIGGLLGLCMGISLLSVIEVIYFFFLRGIRVFFKC